MSEKDGFELMQIAVQDFSKTCREMVRITLELNQQFDAMFLALAARNRQQGVRKSDRKERKIARQTVRKSLTVGGKKAKQLNKDPTGFG